MSEAVAKPKHSSSSGFHRLSDFLQNQTITVRRSQTIAWAICVVERYPSRWRFALAFSPGVAR